MADDLNTSRSQDRRVGLEEDSEVEYWTDALGVSRDQLAAAVKAVGAQDEDVRRYLASRVSTERTRYR
jgi:Protein of unknown function (DUF3606)